MQKENRSARLDVCVTPEFKSALVVAANRQGIPPSLYAYLALKAELKRRKVLK